MTSVRLRNVSKHYGSIKAAEAHDFEIKDKEFLVILGPTGVGKTTLLRLIAGLEKPDKGDIYFDGRNVDDLDPAQRNVTFVFQQYSLYPHMTVYDNMAFPLRSPRIQLEESKIREKIEQVAKILNITHKLENKATALSGGEMQRVAIGRSLVRSPSIFLMDEPLSSLDAKLRADLRVELKRIHTELDATLLYVTHDQIEAMSLADRIGVMRDGVLLQIGTPQSIYEDPNSTYVAQKLGQPTINLLPVAAVQLESLPKEAATVGIRTEHISLSSEQHNKSNPARVKWTEHLGDQNILHLQCGEFKLEILAPTNTVHEPDSVVYISFDNPLFFDTDGNRVRGET